MKENKMMIRHMVVVSEKPLLLLSHDPSLDREDREAERQAWLDKLKALASFSETTAMIDGWFEDLKQRKAEAREELSGLKESQAIPSREWQSLNNRLDTDHPGRDRREILQNMKGIEETQARLKDERSELYARINDLEVSWGIAEELSALNRACLKAYARSWLDDRVWSSVDEVVTLEVSEQNSTREKVEEVASYEVQLAEAFKELESLDQDFWVEMAGDPVVGAEAFKQLQVALKYRRGQLIRARKQRYELTFETTSKWKKFQKKVDKIKRLLLTTVSSIQRSQWRFKFSQLYNTLKKKMLLEEGNHPAMAEELQQMTQILSTVIFERGKTLGLQNMSAFNDLASLDMGFKQLGEDELLVEFNDSCSGRQELALSVIADILGEDLMSQTRVWGFDRKGVSQETKESEALWKAVSEVCIAYGFITIANNGSRMLIRLCDDDGEMTPLAGFLDALFENFSEVGAYGLGLINAKPQSKLGGAHNTPINSKWDENNRECIAILFDSKRANIIPGTDGGTVNNFGHVCQHRCFSLNQETGAGAFFKGQTVTARFTWLGGGIYSINDLRNVKQFNFEEDGAYEEFELEIKAWTRGDEVSEGLQELLDKTGDYLFEGSAFAESNYRIERWKEWFDANLQLPYVMAYDIGELKGRGKKTLHQLLPKLTEEEYIKTPDGKILYACKGEGEPYTPKSAKEYLEAHGGPILIDSPVWGWSIIDSPEKSTTSMSFQTAAPLIVRAFQHGEYRDLMGDFLKEFSERPKDDEKSKMMDRILSGITGENHTVRYPKAFVRNPISEFWRFFTNTTKTICPTRRIIMEDKGYSGFVIVEEDNHNLWSDDVKMPAAMAAWRSPLIVPSAIQAPLALDRGLILELLGILGKAKRSSLENKKLRLVLDRLMFKQELSEQEALNHLPQMLRGMLDTAELLVVDKRIVVMDVSDVEDMQGDDDGDTVTVDFDEDFVKLCQNTERFWREFYKANNLRPIKIEMTKANQINFGKANSIYDGGAFDLEQVKFVDLFGVECPLVADTYGMGGTKIPSPLGLNCRMLVDINKRTGGKLFKDTDSLWTILFKLGSTPTGPIGAGSNGAPDLLVRALAQTDDNLVLNEYGRRLWQGYSTLASTVQVSIDWAKRVYDILCLVLYDQKKEDGSWLIDFESEITPEKAEAYLVKNTFSKVNFVTFKLVQQAKKTKTTIGSKMLRIVVSDDDRYELFQPNGQWIVDADTTKIYRVESEGHIGIIEVLQLHSFSSENNTGHYLTKKVTRINLMDKTNACFDFDSIYAVGSFMIQPPRQGLDGFGPIEGLAAWKKKLNDLLKTREVTDPQGNVTGVEFAKVGKAAYNALSQSCGNTALVRNAVNFMHYYINEGQDSIREIIDYPEKVKKAAENSTAGLQLDHLWHQVSVEIGTWLGEQKWSERGQVSRGQILKAVYGVIGLDFSTADLMLNDPFTPVSVGDLSFSGVDLVTMLFRNDNKVGDDDVPQCVGQMLIAEILDRSEENIFKSLTIQLEHEVKKRFFGRFEAFADKNNRQSVHLPSRLSLYADRFKDVSGLLDGLCERDDRGRPHWVSPQSCFAGLTRILEADKNTILNSVGFQKAANTALQAALLEHDAHDVAQHFLSAIKSAFVSVSQCARKLKSFTRVNEFPVRLFDSRGSFDHKRVETPNCLHPVNLFASRFLSLEAILSKLVIQARLPDAQYSRSLQDKALMELARRGHPIKSFSYFGNSGIKYPDDMRVLHFCILNGPPPSLNTVENDARKKYYTLLAINFLGQEVEKALTVLHKFRLVSKSEDGQLVSPLLTLLDFSAPAHGSGRKYVRLANPVFEILKAQGWPVSGVMTQKPGPQYFRVLCYEHYLKQFIDTGEPNDFVQAIYGDGGKVQWIFDGRRYFNLDDLKQVIQKRIVL